jgi:protein-tyrosine kinase
MDLIEQAAKRLEELRRAGVEPSAEKSPAGSAHDVSAVAREHLPTPEAAMRGVAGHAKAAAVPPATASKSGETARGREHAPGPQELSPSVELDLIDLAQRGFVTPDAPKSQIADEFRIIKRPIIANARSASGTRIANGNLVMVTSALPAEGKTFTAVNLAMSVAMELDTTVLLVDGDVAHPDLPRLLGVRASPGLLDVLTRDDVDIGDALVRTNIENLSVLPAGAPHRRATELLASEQMAMLLRELAARYADRIIIFDSPPLLATTEARVLATHMGQIVMVVAADSTRQHAVNLALAAIESCPNVLMLLNKAEKTDVGTYYGYYADEATR